ncbi:unnamed protein product [Cylindrotheca closterium]|uniref:Uncharacterized protein n=1 Tax=Cylindrotheca closterium TaxID=2856 RepID=A0AAD2CKV0_9STRA|nr:unnamed protein product [Cylindrotheca closterium]
MTHIRKTLLEQNNATVAFLRSNDFRALESSILALSCYNQTFPDEGLTAKDQSSGSMDEYMLLSPITDRESSGGSGTTFIYNHAIIIRTTTAAEIDPTVLAYILVFNAALAHHQLAEHNSVCHCTRMHLLTRAKQLYELAYESCDLEHNPLFQFALINNIAVIERDIGNVSTADDCFEYLLTIFIVFVDQGCELRLQRVSGFVVNVPLAIKNAPAA